MRLGSSALLLLALLTNACTVTTLEPAPLSEDEPSLLPPPSNPPSQRANGPDAPSGPPSTPKPASPGLAPAADAPFAEVVLLLMRDKSYKLWFCTGTLVSKDTVITAAHCLEPTKFVSYRVIAPLAPDAPRVSASNPRSFGGHYSMVENPDLGVLTLDTPIELPQYAELTDVVAQVESGATLSAAAIVRTDQVPESPLTQGPVLPLSSTVQYGYLHGFGTPYFSKGGDSGAGLFLVENGKPTHKLVGVARQPEPDRDLDHFTRVDAELLAWYGGLSD